MYTYTATYQIGQIVYLKTDPEQFERMVTAVYFKGNGNVVYTLTFGTQESDHYDIEISSDENVMKRLDVSNKTDTAQ